LRKARLLPITRLLQRLGVRVLVPLHRRRRGCLPEAWNDWRLLRLQAARRLKRQGVAVTLRTSVSRGAELLEEPRPEEIAEAESENWTGANLRFNVLLPHGTDRRRQQTLCRHL